MPSPAGASAPSRRLPRIGAPLALVTLCGLHVAVTWLALGGRESLLGPWPWLQADHGLHYSLGLTNRDCLRATGFAAGYDPNFMAGSALSVIAASFTLVGVLMSLLPGVDPAVVYKLTVCAAVAAPPVLIAWACLLFGSSARGAAWGTGLYLAYFWSDFPINYVGFGMVAFLLSVPAGLVAVALLVGYLERGGPWRWIAAALGCSTTFLIHSTSPMVVGVAGLAAYGLTWTRSLRGGPAMPRWRHLGFWALAPAILAANGFWFLPGWWLRGTVGDTSFAFAHPESVVGRVAEIFWREAAIESVLVGLGLVGLARLGPARPVAAAGLAGLVAAGFGWGYLAGAFRALDVLQPGRQTYACYSGLGVAAGIGLDGLLARLRDARPVRLDRWATLAILLIGGRTLGPDVARRVEQSAFGPVPYLAAQPPPAAVRLVAEIRRHFRPGERLLFEETGFGIRGLTDPFDGRHFSPILPPMTGVEMLGGPYLHMPLTTNFTQFGEEKLFGLKNWGRDHFVRYARLYRPTAIACWTPHARAFCRDNPDLVQVLTDDPILLLGRVVGFEGGTIRGKATVRAGPNRLVANDLKPDADGLVVLRYHWAPDLVAEPAVPLVAIPLEDDPVPFLGIRPDGPGPVTIRLALPPRSGWWGRPASPPPPR